MTSRRCSRHNVKEGTGGIKKVTPELKYFPDKWCIQRHGKSYEY